MRLRGRRVVHVKSLDAWIPLATVADAHLGARSCDKEAFFEHIEWIRRHKSAIWVSIGDLANLIIPGDKRWNSQEVDKEFYDMLQDGGFGGKVIDYLVNILDPIKDRGVFMLAGNHEKKYDAMRDHAVTQSVVKELRRGVPKPQKVQYGGSDVCGKTLVFTDPHGKKAEYNIIACHGGSGATTKAGKLRVLLTFAQNLGGGDLYLMGHMHDILSPSVPQVSIGNGSTQLIDTTARAVLCGSFLRTYGNGFSTYSGRKGYGPVSLGNPIIWIQPSTKKTRVED